MKRTGLAASLALLAALGGEARAIEEPLNPAQTELLELVSVLQVASEVCGAVVDRQLIGLVIRKEGLTLQTDAEKKVIANALADGRLRFAPRKRGVECLVILDQYGPNGTVTKGLLRKR